jgi:hypothetical protein
MPELPEPLRGLSRLPRQVYWLVGAVIACSGAALANWLSADLPTTDRAPYWIAGSAVIFIGLWILSLGTRARTGERQDDG